MVVTFANEKGGVGKTTGALNLAVVCAWAKLKTMLVDMDKQENSVYFGDRRMELLQTQKLPNITVMKLTEKTIEQIRDFDHQVIVIDVGGHNDIALRKSIALSDICIIPLQPSALDVVTTQRMIGLIDEIRCSKPDLMVFFLLNKLKPGVKANDEVEDIFSECSIPFLKTRLYDRVAFQYGVPEGRGVIEFDDPKAKDEISSLYNEIIELLKKR